MQHVDSTLTLKGRHRMTPLVEEGGQGWAARGPAPRACRDAASFFGVPSDGRYSPLRRRALGCSTGVTRAGRQRRSLPPDASGHAGRGRRASPSPSGAKGVTLPGSPGLACGTGAGHSSGGVFGLTS